MGYYTDYRLQVSGLSENNQTDDIEYHLAHISGYRDWTVISYDPEFVMLLGSSKWYNCDQDMIELSKLYPHLMFELHGVGEGVADLWHMKVKNGESERVAAQLVWPSFEKF